MRQALPAIDATFRVADFMRFKRFPENGSSRAVGLADIVSDAFLFVDIDEKIRNQDLCRGRRMLDIHDIFHSDLSHIASSAYV